jgi:hypothetical protein
MTFFVEEKMQMWRTVEIDGYDHVDDVSGLWPPTGLIVHPPGDVWACRIMVD